MQLNGTTQIHHLVKVKASSTLRAQQSRPGEEQVLSTESPSRPQTREIDTDPPHIIAQASTRFYSSEAADNDDYDDYDDGDVEEGGHVDVEPRSLRSLPVPEPSPHIHSTTTRVRPGIDTSNEAGAIISGSSAPAASPHKQSRLRRTEVRGGEEVLVVRDKNENEKVPQSSLAHAQLNSAHSIRDRLSQLKSKLESDEVRGLM